MEIVDFSKTNLCRICLTTEQKEVKNLFTETTINLMELCAFTSVEFQEHDNLSQVICVECLEFIQKMFLFRLKIISSDIFLRNRKEKKIDSQEENEELMLTQKTSKALEKLISDLDISENDDDEFNSTEDFIKERGMKYECIYCSRGFEMKCRYDYHMKIHGSSNEQCPVCKKMFKNKRYVTVHMKTHTDTQKYTCTKCFKVYSSKSNLGKHMRFSHEPKKKSKLFLCHICSKEFSTSTHLNNHLQIHEPKIIDGTFMCEICEKMFTTKINLNKHLVIHNTKNIFSCTICQKQFRQSKHLKEHIIVHTQEKTFFCKLCNKCFARPNQLKVHTKIHLNEKDVSCPLCSRKFTQLGNMKRHLSIVHKNEKIKKLN